ncbi:hypothetical protein COEREDRAFT_101640 [Coemansia reversa NRRL 1564]|uniref:Uncharacterized protein n=1 Tax=Coemansia reversa (strain ATCC 12441 / NRRL 1564) TaxID=763665 RepID=A0A2G5BEX2_COERN|nr:hypothetical protein COEREDRAFT_101640 [Coemansia reversa NRRL 1564]|eukprot:PIA17576.1 hypothetical protein COEREDRAFT_101640 [Coemansia reversa NRRL 1564]
MYWPIQSVLVPRTTAAMTAVSARHRPHTHTCIIISHLPDSFRALRVRRLCSSALHNLLPHSKSQHAQVPRLLHQNPWRKYNTLPSVSLHIMYMDPDCLIS